MSVCLFIVGICRYIFRVGRVASSGVTVFFAVDYAVLESLKLECSP